MFKFVSWPFRGSPIREKKQFSENEHEDALMDCDELLGGWRHRWRCIRSSIWVNWSRCWYCRGYALLVWWYALHGLHKGLKGVGLMQCAILLSHKIATITNERKRSLEHDWRAACGVFILIRKLSTFLWLKLCVTAEYDWWLVPRPYSERRRRRQSINAFSWEHMISHLNKNFSLQFVLLTNWEDRCQTWVLWFSLFRTHVDYSSTTSQFCTVFGVLYAAAGCW